MSSMQTKGKEMKRHNEMIERGTGRERRREGEGKKDHAKKTRRIHLSRSNLKNFQKYNLKISLSL